LVEHQLPKLRVASSSLVSRSFFVLFARGVISIGPGRTFHFIFSPSLAKFLIKPLTLEP